MKVKQVLQNIKYSRVTTGTLTSIRYLRYRPIISYRGLNVDLLGIVVPIVDEYLHIAGNLPGGEVEYGAPVLDGLAVNAVPAPTTVYKGQDVVRAGLWSRIHHA